MKLFLTSYLAGTKGLVEEFLSEEKPGEIVFIPTAANVEEYRGYVDEGAAVLREMGYALRNLDVAAVTRDEAAHTIASCECLCISGGNTFFLLQELKKTGLLTLLRKRFARACSISGNPPAR